LIGFYPDQYLRDDIFNRDHKEQHGYSLDDLATMAEGMQVATSPCDGALVLIRQIIDTGHVACFGWKVKIGSPGGFPRAPRPPLHILGTHPAR
jgi:hypothetical protein